MINVCIYCGENKSRALEECESCLQTPSSHQDIIHSIIVCFSETEPYLNFLTLEEVESIREKIIDGSPITLKTGVFEKAEEAYSAVRSNNGPKAIQFFSTITFPITAVIALTILAMIFM